MKNILLISEKQLKEQSTIEINVDGKLLSKIIANVQNVQLQPILGTDKYNSVLYAVYGLITDGTALPDDVKELLDEYITPFLINATICDFIVLNNFKLTNKGVLKMNDASSSNVPNTELDYIKNYYENYTAVYKNRLVGYLKTTKQLLTNADADVTSYSIGWYLDKDIAPSNIVSPVYALTQGDAYKMLTPSEYLQLQEILSVDNPDGV